MADRSRASRQTATTVLVLVFAFLYVPIAVLVALSFNEGGLPTVWSGFSFKWYVSLAGNRDILSAALNTLIVAVASTAIATLLGTLLAI
ncbi:MAG: ABC transporter permease, partial [Hyphomicrobiales bacterium]|nr:ABC transporter permease [Hyphomicrobiales bacterium]